MDPLPLPSETLPERVLLEKIAGGSLDAVGELWIRYAAAVHAHARRIVFDPDEAATVVDDVLAEVQRQARSFDRSALPNLSLWLFELTQARAHATLATTGLGRREARAS